MSLSSSRCFTPTPSRRSFEMRLLFTTGTRTRSLQMVNGNREYSTRHSRDDNRASIVSRSGNDGGGERIERDVRGHDPTRWRRCCSFCAKKARRWQQGRRYEPRRRGFSDKEGVGASSKNNNNHLRKQSENALKMLTRVAADTHTHTRLLHLPLQQHTTTTQQQHNTQRHTHTL